MAKRNVVLHDKYKSTTALYPKIDAKSLTPEAITEITRITEVVVEEQVVPNETPVGTPTELQYITIGGTEYYIKEGTLVIANPTLAGTEADLTGIQVGETKYKVPSGGGGTTRYLHNIRLQKADMGSVVTCQVITNSNTAFTKNSFMNFLENNGLKYSSGSYHILPCNGCDSVDNVNYWGLSYYSSGNLNLFSGVVGGTITDISGSSWDFEDIVI